MNNAEMFMQTFGIYATELWAMPEKEFLKWLNSAHPVKHGKWKQHYEVLEKTSEYVISASGYECSECGTIFHNQWDFCGNCGAVMEKVDEN